MFELAFLTAVAFIAAVALVTIHQRRKDVLYGPYIEEASWSAKRQDEGVEASSS